MAMCRAPFGLGPRFLTAFHAARPLPLCITCASSGLKPQNLRVTFATCLSLCIRRGPTWACPFLMPTIATWGRCRPACPHVHHPVSTGKSTSADKWNLSQVASWPERLCQFLAAAFDFSLQADGETRRPSKPKANLADLNPHSGSSPSDPHSRGNPVISDPSGSSSLDPHSRGNQVISDPSGSSSLRPAFPWQPCDFRF